MSLESITNVLVVGVGGQGVVLASNILCEIAARAGFDVKKSEIHGMSQRGGVVTSHVRFGPKVYGSLIASQQTDALLGFEAAESLRFAHEVKPGGAMFASTQKIKPPTGGGLKAAKYPEDALEQAAKICKGTLVPVEAHKIAVELGNARLSNTILLGALSTSLDIDQDIWVETIKKMVPPKTIELNVQAFERGRQVVADFDVAVK
ncbi:indolepyruvate oxidoreductase subunit beta [bacterium]|nr:indolepyruvate oxidoreductase subunit beta [bacterium]